MLALAVAVAAVLGSSAVPASRWLASAEEIHAGQALAERFECARCHEGAGLATPTADKACVGCHAQIHAGTFEAPPDILHRWQTRIVDLIQVPSLEGTGTRLRQAWVRDFLLKPHDVRPGMTATMPRLALTADDAEKLAQWLAPDATPFDEDAAPVMWFASARSGRRLADTKGCGVCHRMSGLPGGVAGGLAASVLPITIEPAKLAEGVALAPDLAWTRIRFRREALVAWLIDPPLMKPATTMPKLGLSRSQAEDIAEFLLETPLEPGLRAPPPARLPVLTRRVPFAEVRDRVFKHTCWHCHSEPDLALGDGGPGNTGGFGFKGRGLSLVNYEMIMAGAIGDDGERRSIFKPVSATDKTPRLVAHLVARQVEEAGGEIPGIRGMPLGLPALSSEDLQLVESWIQQGRPE